MKRLADMFAEAHALGVIIFALVTLGAGLLTANVILPEAAGIDTQPLGDDYSVAPASGVEGLDVEAFCRDPLTVVLALAAPDASGVSYQLGRVRDAKTETVLVVLSEGAFAATHYFDTTEGQQSAPAFVTTKARDCIEDKAQ